MRCPDCGARAEHFRCLGCGMHQLHDHIPCWKCKWWKFAPLNAAGAELFVAPLQQFTEVGLTITEPMSPQPKTTKKQRGTKPPT